MKLMPYKHELDAESVDERMVIFREEEYEDIREWSDHPFVMWSNNRKIKGDRDASSPFEDEDNMMLVKGIVAFPIAVYEHGGFVYALDGGSGFTDARWDVMLNSVWLWIDDDRCKEWFGKTIEEIGRDKLKEYAEGEVRELNLAERGCWYGWRLEEKRKWRKTFADGKTEDGYDWAVKDSCGGYLAEDADEVVGYATGEYTGDGDVPPIFTEEYYY